MQNLAFLSHHKTGTSYSRRVLKSFHSSEQAAFADFQEYLGGINRLTGEKISEYQPHPEGTLYHLANACVGHIRALPANTRLVHFLRDPRGIILSAISYHLRGSEEWTTVEKEKFGGKSYQEYLANLRTQEEQVEFEISESSGRVITDMVSVAGFANVTSFRLEDISHDLTCNVHFQLSQATGLLGKDLVRFFNSACEHTLWNADKLPKHSTSGVNSDFDSLYSPEAYIKYIEAYGELHQTLGYSDTSM